MLEGPLFQHYFEKVEVSNFEVASDAFSTFKVNTYILLYDILFLSVVVDKSCRQFQHICCTCFLGQEQAD